MELTKYLKRIFFEIKKRQKALLVLAILILLGLSYLRYVIVIIFIALAGVSKIYHRLFRSTLGIDLVLFTSLMTSLVYSPSLGLIVAWFGLIIADNVGSKFTHFSIGTLVSLTLIVLSSKFFISLPLVLTLIILTIAFEILMAFSYYILGSSIDKIILFLISHLSWNLILILSFAEKIKEIMLI